MHSNNIYTIDKRASEGTRTRRVLPFLVESKMIKGFYFIKAGHEEDDELSRFLDKVPGGDIRDMERHLQRRGFFVGGLSDEAIIYHYKNA